MTQKRSISFIALLAVLTALVVGAIALALPALAENRVTPEPTIVTFDVAEDMNRFVWDKDTVHEDGMPAYGSAFYTEGWLYPAGTLDGTNGVIVNEDGTVEPEFPELVVGTWACYGYMIGDGARTETGPWVASTQIYNLGDQAGEETIVTTGFELVDFNTNVERAVVGGTGQYAHASGELHQQLLGFNQSEGVVLRVEFDLQNVEETAALGQAQ
ncbi:MAG TPA: hypothetical protein PKE64_02430 [Anaerolineae bacterium]|nr:hypothetical protein [Anaerolineae bacterium]HMR62844.1 hypothetical protein [Anaerolineae bacterium]